MDPMSARRTVHVSPLADRVELVPILGGPASGMISTSVTFDRVTQIAYPLPGLNRLIDGRPIEPAPEPLDLLLGAVRASLLRTLDQPHTKSQLASVLDGPLSKITYHCDHLEAVGFIRRERSGNRVWVSRTGRGDQLLDVMG